MKVYQIVSDLLSMPESINWALWTHTPCAWIASKNPCGFAILFLLWLWNVFQSVHVTDVMIQVGKRGGMECGHDAHGNISPPTMKWTGPMLYK